MDTGGNRNTVEQQDGKPSASERLFFRLPTSVVLIGLIYAIIAATVVHLLGGALWTVMLAFLLGGASAIKIAAVIRADILRRLYPSGASSDPLSEQKNSARPEEPDRAEQGGSLLSPSGDQRADDTAGV